VRELHWECQFGGASVKLPRRKFLHLAVGAAALPAVSRIARAQAYPTRPVRLIVPAPAGGSFDIVARLMGQWLSERLGQPFVIENHSGAGTNIGTEAVAHAPADGYTLLLAGTPNAINATLYEKLNFNFIRDIAPIAGIAREPNVMVLNPSVPAKTVPEFVAYAKANPRKINMASSGNGSAPHMAGALFMMMTSVDMNHVPYRGATPALTDLLAGQVQVMFPTIGDFVPGYESSAWHGLGAPKNTRAEIIDKLNREVNASLADPKIKTRLADLGGEVLALSPADFGRLIADETEKWRKVIRAANIKAE